MNVPLMLAAFFDRYLYHRGIAQNHQCMGCSVCNVYCAFTCYQVLLLPYFSYILYHTLSIYDLSTPPFCSIQQGEIVSKEVFFFSQQVGFHNNCLWRIVYLAGPSNQFRNYKTTNPDYFFKKNLVLMCWEWLGAQK